MSKSAVLLIIFNRPNTTKQVFDAIRTSKPDKLYIAADGHRHGVLSDLENCKISRAITELIDWPCEVKRLYQEQNLGCSFGPRTAFDWFFSYESEGIILEDDCIPHSDFFEFASEMLERYRYDERIISINGSNLGYTLKDGNSYTFSRFMNMWGWATWRRCHLKIDYNLIHWQNINNKQFYLWNKLRNNCMDIDIAWLNYWRFQFDKTVMTSQVTWWDYQWIYHQLKYEQYAIVPSINLVSNIGFNEQANHTLNSNSLAANISVSHLHTPYKHPIHIVVDNYYEDNYIKKIWCDYKKFTLIQTIKYFIKQIIQF